MSRWAVLWLFVVGCSADKARLDSASEADVPTTGNADMSDMDDEGEAAEEPVAWELGGHIVLDTDVIVEAESALTVRLISDQRTVLCEGEAIIETATAMDSSQYPEDVLLGWWRLFVKLAESDGCFGQGYDFPVPVSILFGIGPMHPEIVAAVGADPELDEVEALNGVYGSMDGGDTLWVFGVIGTDDAFAGTSGPAETAPLSDGIWTIEPVYSFPL